MSVDHYENFPVASLLLPKPLRSAVTAIYHFARRADDIADEGDAPAAERLAALKAFDNALLHMQASHFTATHFENVPARIFLDLQREVKTHALPLTPLHDLLVAFTQDVSHTPFRNEADLLAYCQYSANPVGNLLLHLYDAADEESLRLSDNICTGLQLVNFWQDIAIDTARQRFYLPSEWLAAHGMSHHDLANLQLNDRWPQLMQECTAFARKILLAGAPLGARLRGRPGLELRMIVQGGLRILEKIDVVAGDVFHHRPTLNKKDWAVIVWRSLRKSHYDT